MRIAFIEPSLGISGGIRRIIELSNHLVEMGHDVEIYHPSGEPCAWLNGIAKTRKLGEIDGWDGEVLVYNESKTDTLAIVSTCSPKLTVFYCLGVGENFTGEGCSRSRNLVHILTDPDILFLSNATWMRDMFAETFGVETELLLGGVNPDMFYPMDRKERPNFVIVHSGDTRKRKGTADVRDALRIVREYYRDIDVEYYHKRGFSQQQIAAMYNDADIFVDGQYGYGWANAVLEAMACKTAVVCTDIGAVKDFAVDGETALLVKPGDIESMAKDVIELLGNPYMRYRLSEKGYKKSQQFRWENTAERFVELVNQRL